MNNISSIATYDIQDAKVELTNSSIIFRSEFITNSAARGCFIIFQSHLQPTQTLVFRAILRNDNVSTTLTYTIVDPALSGYYNSILVYDLEYDLLPNQEMALELLDNTLVTTNQPSKNYYFLHCPIIHEFC